MVWRPLRAHSPESLSQADVHGMRSFFPAKATGEDGRLDASRSASARRLSRSWPGLPSTAGAGYEDRWPRHSIRRRRMPPEGAEDASALQREGSPARLRRRCSQRSTVPSTSESRCREKRAEGADIRDISEAAGARADRRRGSRHQRTRNGDACSWKPAWFIRLRSEKE